MCKKLIVLTLSLCLISSVSAVTVNWDFENGNDHRFTLWSVSAAAFAFDDPNIAGDESLTGVGGPAGLPDYGLAWTIGPPTQFDGLKPAADVGNARVDADGLLNYSLGTERIATDAGTLNTYNLNQHGDYIHTQENDQIATSPIVTLDENAVLTVWSWGGGSGTHAPEYDPDPTQMYTDGSSGIAVLSAEEDDMYAILATIHTQGKGTRTEDTLDLSAFAGRKVMIDVVDAFEGGWGWLAIDEIQITNAIQPPLLGFVVQMTAGELAWGLDQAQEDHLISLGYDVLVIEQGEIGSTFTKDDANDLDLLLISESPSSSNADPLIGTSAPVMHQEAYGWDNWAFMGPAENINWLAAQTEVEVVNDTHPIMVDAGFSIGMLPWFTLPDQYTTENISNMAPGAELLCKAAADDLAVVFAVEKGAELYNGDLAPNRRVGFSIPGNQDGPNQSNGIIDASIMSDEQWALYDAALRWLNPPPPELEVAGELLVDVSAADPSAGTATWVNNGTLGDFNFITEFPEGSSDMTAGTPDANLVVEEFEGVPVVRVMSGTDGVAAYMGPDAPESIIGSDDRTMECWVAELDAELPKEQPIAAWGMRGAGDGANCSLSLGYKGYGAFGLWGDDFDMGFGTAPAVGTLHHLVFVIDGDTATTYVDGVFDNTRTFAGTLNTPAAPINLFIQNKLSNGAIALDSRLLPNNLVVNSIRIHSSALTDAQVLNNYEVGPAK